MVPPVQAVVGGSGGSVDGKNKGDGSSGVKPSENSSGQVRNCDLVPIYLKFSILILNLEMNYALNEGISTTCFIF